LVFEYKLSLQELWNVDDRHDDWGKDVGEEVHLGGLAEFVGSVEERLADSKESFSCDAHGQECFPAEEDVLHWVQEIWEDDYVELAADVFRIVHEDETEKHEVTAGKSNQALMEC
jgi:hypothetical protein